MYRILLRYLDKVYVIYFMTESFIVKSYEVLYVGILLNMLLRTFLGK
jgi:hypothetical protein